MQTQLNTVQQYCCTGTKEYVLICDSDGNDIDQMISIE